MTVFHFEYVRVRVCVCICLMQGRKQMMMSMTRIDGISKAIPVTFGVMVNAQDPPADPPVTSVSSAF